MRPVLVAALVFAVLVARADARYRLIRCQDGGSFIYPHHRHFGIVDPPCDEDGQTDGSCTVTVPSPRECGLTCPPCCGEPVTLEVGETIRLREFRVRLRCVDLITAGQ